jgi:hypothetical protein
MVNAADSTSLQSCRTTQDAMLQSSGTHARDRRGLSDFFPPSRKAHRGNSWAAGSASASQAAEKRVAVALRRHAYVENVGRLAMSNRRYLVGNGFSRSLLDLRSPNARHSSY